MTPDRKAMAAAIRCWIANAPTDMPVEIRQVDAAAIADILDPPPVAGEIVVRVAVAMNPAGEYDCFPAATPEQEAEQWDWMWGDGFDRRLGILTGRFPSPVVPTVEGEVE